MDLIAIKTYEPGAAHLARAELKLAACAHYKDAQGLVNPGNRRIQRLLEVPLTARGFRAPALTKDHPELATRPSLH